MSTFNIHDNRKVNVTNHEAPKRPTEIKEIKDESNRIKMFGAAMTNDVDSLKKFLGLVGADSPDFKGNTALLFSTMMRSYDCMKVLINSGADPTRCNTSGLNALEEAKHHGDAVALKILIGG